MKLFLISFLMCLSYAGIAEMPKMDPVLKGDSSLKRMESFTVLTQVSSHPLDLAFKSALENALSSAGKMVEVRSEKSFKENFYSAISNQNFLKLSIENWIVETPSKDQDSQQFKVEVHVILEAFRGYSEKEEPEKKTSTFWVTEKVIDFSPNGKTLINRGTEAVESLVKGCIREYQQANPNSPSGLTFFLL